MEQGLAYQLALMQKPKERSPVDMITGGQHGFRHYDQGVDGKSVQPKGDGWLGNVNTLASGEAVTEWSMDDNGRNVPLLVPGLTKDQVARVVQDTRFMRDAQERGLSSNQIRNSRPDLRDVEGLALRWANDRAKLGYGPYKD